MGGVAKTVGNAVGTGLTLGLNRVGGSDNPFRRVGDFAGSVATGGLSGQGFGIGLGQNGGSPSYVNGGQDPAAMLAQTGGAPILAQIVMGANPDDALAGFLGVPKAEFLDAINGRNTYLSPQQVQDIKSTREMLTSIQNDRNLRQQAVEKVIADFPNIAADAAKARAAAGGEFDATTKQYMQNALNNVAAKYAAGGGLSSGAFNEALAKTGGDLALSRLDFQNQRENTAYNNGLNYFNTRLGEVNALRDFQNTMLGQVSQQGFSAQQAALQRQFQGQMQSADWAHQNDLANQQSKNALFGALGGVGGSILGAALLGPAGAGIGGSVGGSLFGSTSPRLNFGSGGGAFGPGINTSQYAPSSIKGY